MAVAFTKRITEIQMDGAVRKMSLDLTYVGADVPDTLLNITVTVDISSVVSVAGLPSVLATAIRLDAQSRQLTIPANQVWLPSYQAA